VIRGLAFVLLLGASILGIGVVGVPSIQRPAPAPLGDVAAAAPDWRGRFPNVPLVTQEGRTVRFYDDLLRGRLVALNFFYIECEGTCPGVTSMLVEVERALGPELSRELRILSISLEPERDSPERLRDYARRYGAGPRIVFLTGRPENVDLVRRAMGFSHPEDPARDLDRQRHAALLRLGNEAEGWWSVCPSAASARTVEDALRSLDRRPVDGAGHGPLEFPDGAPPIELRKSEELAARLEFSRVLDRLDRVCMSRVPRSVSEYLGLILSPLAEFLRVPAEAGGRFSAAARQAEAELARARTKAANFRAANPYDPGSPDSVVRARHAWKAYVDDRSRALDRLEAALPPGPRAEILREQAVLWTMFLEEHPEHPLYPPNPGPAPVRKK
jgi:protein SCO1/2